VQIREEGLGAWASKVAFRPHRQIEVAAHVAIANVDSAVRQHPFSLDRLEELSEVVIPSD